MGGGETPKNRRKPLKNGEDGSTRSCPPRLNFIPSFLPKLRRGAHRCRPSLVPPQKGGSGGHGDPAPPSSSSIALSGESREGRDTPLRNARCEGMGGGRPQGPSPARPRPRPPRGTPPRPHRLVRLHADLEGLLLQRLQRHGHRHGGTGTGRRRLLPAAPQHATHAAAILGGPAASAAAPEMRHRAPARALASRDAGTVARRGRGRPMIT